MADEEEAGGKKKGGLIRIVIFVVAGLLLVGIGLGAGWFFFRAPPGDPAQIADQIIARETAAAAPAAPAEGEGAGEEGAEGEAGPPEKVSKDSPKDEVFRTLYYEIPGNITTNLRDSRRFLQIGVGISTQYDESVLTNVETHLPALRSAILAALSDYSEADVVGREARSLLAEDIRTTLNTVLEELEGFGGIEGVHFTAYVMQ